MTGTTWNNQRKNAAQMQKNYLLVCHFPNPLFLLQYPAPNNFSKPGTTWNNQRKNNIDEVISAMNSANGEERPELMPDIYGRAIRFYLHKLIVRSFS